MPLYIRLLTALWMIGAAIRPSAAEAASPSTSTGGSIVPDVALPGTGYVVRRDGSAATSQASQRELLKAIADWLSSEFELPATGNPPLLKQETARGMLGLRFRDLPPDRWAGHEGDIVAIYDDATRTIYLPAGWSDKTAADLSVLVHEMVHHMQNEAGLKFACPEVREEMAFAAQEKWLALFGGSLEADFGLDRFTLMVRTHCL